MLVALVIQLCTIVPAADSVSLLDFYPFGREHGDTEIPSAQLESVNERVSLLPGVPIRGRAYDRVLVSTRGYLKFRTIEGNELRFWNLTVLQNGIADFTQGNVYYRQTDNPDLLNSTATEVTKYFSSQDAFNPTWAMVITWFEIQIVNHEDEPIVTTETLIRSDVNICDDGSSTAKSPMSTDESVTSADGIRTTPAACVNVSDATYVMETAVHSQSTRTTTATFQAVLTTDGEYTYYLVNYNGIVACRGTDVRAPDDTTSDFSVTRDLLLPGTTNLGEHGKWMLEIGQGCSDRYDLVFALDTSGSVQPTDLQTTKNVVSYILHQLRLGHNNIRVGLISFDDTASTVSALSGSRLSLNLALSGVKVTGGRSNLAEAISSVRSVVSQQNGGRPEVTKVCVIFTDGKSTQDPSIQANLARSKNIAIIVVGVGKGIDDGQLRSIGVEPADYNVLTLFNHDLLPLIQDMVIDKICLAQPNQDPKTKVDVNVPEEGVFSKTKGTMLGGQAIDVYGPCFTPGSLIRATFGSQTTSCSVVNTDVATCTAPMVYFTGTVDVILEVDGKKLYGRYTYENPLHLTNGVTRIDSHGWLGDTDVTITYDPDAIPGNEVNVDLIGYKENTKTGTVSTENLYTIAQNVRKSGTLSFRRPSLVGLGDFSIGAIRVSGADNRTISLWSDIHPLFWAVDVTSSDVCHQWITEERDQADVRQEVMSQCPCALQQAENEIGRFRIESDANNRKCFSTVDSSVRGFNQRCCYDGEGSLLDARHLTGGATSVRYSPFTSGLPGAGPSPGTVPVFSQLYQDTVPFYHCCMGSNVTEHCPEYFRLRPPSDCRQYGGYRPTAVGVIDSDPIVSTLDGEVYVFSTVGEFVIMETKNTDLRIQGRTGPSKTYTGEAVLTSLAMVNTAGGSDVVQIGLEYNRGQPLFVMRVNGRLDFSDHTGTIPLDGLTVTRESDSRVLVRLSGRGVAVQVTYVGDHLDAVFYVPPDLHGQLTGILGFYDGISENDFTTRDGAVMAVNSSTADLHEQFVMSWKLSTDKESLFVYPKGSTFYSKSINDPSYQPSYVDAVDAALQTITRRVRDLCGDSLDCQVQLQRKLDRGSSLNDTALGTVKQFRLSLQEVTVCPFLDPSVDRTLQVNVSGYRPGAVAYLGCPPGWSVVGYDRLLCQDTGEWDGNATYCEGVLFADPPAGTMLGGQQIAIRGPHLEFETGVTPYIRMAGVTVRCEYGGRYVAYCRTPTVTMIGVTTIYANVMNGDPTGWVYRGQYVYQNMAAFTPGVLRQNAEQWTVKGQHVITWSADDVDSPSVMIELYGYKEDLLTGKVIWQKLLTLKEQHDAKSGEFLVDSTSISIPEGFTAGILKITPTTGTGSALWSDVHPLTWATTMDHKSLCRQFTSHDRTLTALDQSGLISCPCSVERARTDDTNFKLDPGCSPNSATTINCLYNKGAQICFRSIPINGWEQRCCYDDRGVLLNARDFTGGATPGRYHHDGISPYSSAGNVPHLSHFTGDVMPYLHCCVHSKEFSADYFAQRRPSDCVSEFPPRPALIEGDPHFITFDEVSYTFDGLGEFVIMHAMNGSLQVQGRTEILTGVRGTCFTSFAMKHVDTAVVEIRRSDDRQQVDIFYDRRQLMFNLTAAREYGFSGITIDVESPSKLSVSFPHLSFVMDIEVADEMLNAMLSVPRNFTDNTEGLLGTYNGDPADDFTSRDGYVIRQGHPSQSVHANFGLSWRVTKAESLFNYDLVANYEFYNNKPYTPEYKATSDIDNRLESGFIKTMCGTSKDCMYDYINKGRLSVAPRPEDKRMRDRYWLRLQDLTTSQSCGFLDTIPEGMSREVSGYAIGATIRLSCSPGYVLVGASLLLCTDQGWSQAEGRCEAIRPSTEPTTHRVPNPSFAVQETDSTPSWAVGAVVGAVGGVAAIGGTVLVVRGVLVAKEVARIQAYRLMSPQFGTTGSARPSFKPQLL